jgi:ankyrin repeat protein
MTTPDIFEACAYNYIETAAALLERGVDANQRYPDGVTLLQMACKTSALCEIVQMLISHGADVNALGGPHGTAFDIALGTGHYATARLLIENGLDPNTTTSRGLTPFHYTCGRGYTTLMQMLITKGADINTVCTGGNTPLHTACWRGDVSSVAMLIENGVHLNANVFTDVCNYVSLDIVRLFIVSGCEPVTDLRPQWVPEIRELVGAHKEHPIKLRLQLAAIPTKAVLMIKSAAYQQVAHMCYLDTAISHILCAIKCNKPCDI